MPVNYSPDFFDEIVQESLPSANVVVPLVLDLVRPNRVIDVGCATGVWLSVFRDHGVKAFLGLDGAYVEPSKLLIPRSRFRTVDLEKSFSLPTRFDLAISLEVAEHLPAVSAIGFVTSLCELAPVVLFSAAVPGQGGENHQNEQWPEYWRQLFLSRKFRMFDPIRPLIWQDERVAFYYRQNLFLFVREDYLSDPPLMSRLTEVKCGEGLMLVAPHILFGLHSRRKRVWRMLWGRIRRRMLRLLGFAL